MSGGGGNRVSRRRGSYPRGDCVLALDGASRQLSGSNVLEPNVAVDAAEERDAAANEHGHTRDDETIDQTGPKEGLNRESAVDVDVL